MKWKLLFKVEGLGFGDITSMNLEAMTQTRKQCWALLPNCEVEVPFGIHIVNVHASSAADKLGQVEPVLRWAEAFHRLIGA